MTVHKYIGFLGLIVLVLGTFSVTDVAAAKRRAVHIPVGPQIFWYADQDSDGFGDINTSTLTPPAGGRFATKYVRNGTDCDDRASFIWQRVPDLVSDFDRDGYANGGGKTQCVGNARTKDGRTYYSNPHLIACNLGSVAHFMKRSDSMGLDKDDCDPARH